MKFNKKTIMALLAATTMANTFDYVEAMKRKSPEGEQEEPAPKAPSSETQENEVHELLDSALNRSYFFNGLILPYLQQQDANNIREEIGLAQEQSSTTRDRTLDNPGLTAMIVLGLNANHMPDLITALNIAQKFTDPQEQRVFFNVIAERNQELIIRMFRAAAATNRIALITAIMQTAGNHISKGTLSLSLQYAAANGQLEMVMYLFENYGKFLSNASLGWTLRNAAENGNLVIVTYLIEHAGNRISDIALGRALRDAAENNHLAVVTYFIEHVGDHISNATLNTALAYAQDYTIVTYLINLAGVEIANAALGEVFLKAASSGNHELIIYLIQHFGEHIDSEYLGAALREAIENSHQEVAALIGKTIEDREFQE